MSLKTELSTKLDTSTLVTNLLDGTGASADSLDGVTLPTSVAQLGEAQQKAGLVNTSGIAPAVGQVASGIAPLLQSVPAAQEVLGPITTSLEIIEGLQQEDLQSQFDALTTRLSSVFEGPRDEGFVGVLVQLADAFAAAPERQTLMTLLERLQKIVRFDLPAGSFELPALVSALQGTAMTVGGLMSLESTLSEAERLTGIMQAQFDLAEVSARRDALVACLTGGSASLSQFLAGIDVTKPAQVQAGQSALDACSSRLVELVEVVSQGSGFGEATLLYLDMPHMQEKVAHAAGLVRNADIDPLEQALRSLQERISPALSVDLSGAPTFSLDDLISTLESRVTQIAAGIDAFDLSQLTNPLTESIAVVTALPNTLTAAIGEVTVAVQAALGQLRDAVAALPFQSIGNAIHQALQPITQALEFLGALVDTIKAALDAAVTSLKSALGVAENAVDKFKQDIEALFQDAATFIASLHLDKVLTQVAENIRAFSDQLAQAQMKPYFDTAVDVIGTTTSVIEKVPFSLLPDSMEQEVVAAIRPIKNTDLNALENEIESLLQIGPDGKFQLRPGIELAVADIQTKYDELIDEIKRLDPHKVVEQLDVEFGKLARKIQDISPRVELAPVQQAIDQLRSAVASFDLNVTLKPLREAFTQLLAEADKYSPAALIVPLETRLDNARNKLIGEVRLREWAANLDMLSTRARELLDRLDPVQLQPIIRSGMQEALDLLEEFPEFQFAGGFGTLVASLLSGIGLNVEPLAFNAVLDWLQGTSGASALTDRTRRIADAITATRAEVEVFDPAALAASLMPQLERLRSAVASLPPGTARASLEEALNRIDLVNSLGNLARNRERYLASLSAAEAAAQTLSRTGLSEVDIKVTRLQTAFAPLAPIKKLILDIFARLGITGFEQGMGEALRRLFAVATPERLAGILTPLFTALRGRIVALIDAVLIPLKLGVADLLTALDAISLASLRQAVDGVYQTARQQIAGLHPDILLADVVTAFGAAQARVAAFNPLTDVEAALIELRNTTTRILGKLNAGQIMATPLQIYDTLIGLLGQLDLNALLVPLFDQLDNIAKQVDEGLDETVTSFRRLQDALPSTVGSTSTTGSASVGVG
jgi:hypothetical protein